MEPSAVSEIKSESIKPRVLRKGYPTPGYTYGPAVLPLTLLGDSRGQPCIHPSPSVSISLHQFCASPFAPAALLSSDGHMTLSDLHTHTSSDKAGTLKTHPDHSDRLSVSVQTQTGLGIHAYLVF